MAKQQRSIKRSQAVGQHGRGQSFEEHESYDDSLLPDSTELARLKELDPNIIEWIKERTAKEQDGRLSFNDRKMTLLENSTTKAFRMDLYTVTCAFLVIMASMGFSYVLIDHGHLITGSIFAGATILYAASSFLNFRKDKKTNRKEEK